LYNKTIPTASTVQSQGWPYSCSADNTSKEYKDGLDTGGNSNEHAELKRKQRFGSQQMEDRHFPLYSTRKPHLDAHIFETGDDKTFWKTRVSLLSSSRINQSRMDATAISSYQFISC
ncbi:unnamed protein product, partial [Fusarium graminearum]